MVIREGTRRATQVNHFFFLTVLGGLYYWANGGTPTGESPMVYMHMSLYFTDPLWIAAHNFGSLRSQGC